jgi:NAD(P)-dependent dehydrogenase (short-subunit alcohol dehydrogenase family)
MLDWAHKLKADGVRVWAVGPGFLETDLGGMREQAKAMGTKHASVGGQFIRSVVEGARDADVGKIVVAEGISAP